MTRLPDTAALLGTGRRAEVFAVPEGVLKLLRQGGPRRAVFREAAHLAVAEGLGLPVPSVVSAGQFGDRWGLVMSRAEGPALAERLATASPAGVPALMAEMVALQRRLQAAAGDGLPSLVHRLRRQVAEASLDDRVKARHLDALARDGDSRLCHYDFHPWNIIGAGDRAVVIDWLDAAAGPPDADSCRSYLLLRLAAPALAEPYLAAATDGRRARRAAVLRWLPILAAARLSEGVEGERDRLLALASGA